MTDEIRSIEGQLASHKSESDHLAFALSGLCKDLSSSEDLLYAAVVLKESGYNTHAEEIFERLIASASISDQVQYEYIQFLRKLGRADDADGLLENFLKNSSPGENVIREAVIRLTVESREFSPQRGRLLEALVPAISDGRWSAYGRLSAYFLSFDIKSIMDHLQSEKLMSPETCAEHIAQALGSRQPFAMIRLGDGEGAYLHPPTMDDPKFTHLLDEHRAFYATRWYADKALALDSGFRSVATELQHRLKDADIIGIPGYDWIAHEIKLRNPPVLVNCLQVARVVDHHRFWNQSRLTTTSIAVDMEYRGLVRSLLKMTENPVVITSQGDLPARLRAVGLAETCRPIFVPPPASAGEQANFANGKSHFRDVFPAVLASLEAVGPGDLVLVGAGFLGKLYALRAKERGAVAVDVGALFDLWSGAMTRPSFLRLRHLIL